MLEVESATACRRRSACTMIITIRRSKLASIRADIVRASSSDWHGLGLLTSTDYVSLNDDF